MGLSDKSENGLSLLQENVALKLAAGHKVSETAKEFSLATNTIHRWLTDPTFSDRVQRIGTDAIRAGVSWATTRYQTYLDTCEEIALDESKSTRDRLHALEMLLKRAEKAKEDGLQRQLEALQKAVFGESAIDIIAREVKEAPEVGEDDDYIEDPGGSSSQATPEEPRG